MAEQQVNDPRLRVPDVPWRLRDVLWGAILAFGLFVGVVVLAPLLQGMERWPGVILALAELVFIVAAWAFSVRRPGVHWRDLGLRSFQPLLGCLGAISLFYLTLAVEVAWGLLLQWLGWPGQTEILPLFGEGWWALALAFVATGIAAPVAEELFFRGFALPPLQRRLGRWLGIAINAALFALLHFTPTVFPPLFIMGVFFCLLYEYTGSIWPGILLHAGINTLAVALAYLMAK